MKTPMQELIEVLESVGWKLQEEIKSEFLEKEKQQSIDFASKCQLIRDVDCDGNVTFCFDPKEQFDKTFS